MPRSTSLDHIPKMWRLNSADVTPLVRADMDLKREWRRGIKRKATSQARQLKQEEHGIGQLLIPVFQFLCGFRAFFLTHRYNIPSICNCLPHARNNETQTCFKISQSRHSPPSPHPHFLLIIVFPFPGSFHSLFLNPPSFLIPDFLSSHL